MMKPTLNDVHHQFAEFFHGDLLAPYAYLVSKKLSEGHICLDLSTVEAQKESLPTPYRSGIRANPQLNKERLVGLPGAWQPFILDQDRLYLQRYFRYETMILEGIFRLIHAEAAVKKMRCEALVSHSKTIGELFGDAAAARGTHWQLAAVLLGVVNNLTLITGGPGTGKTTTLSRLLRILYMLEPDLKVALAAPTGKAAMRMAESLHQAINQARDPIAEKIGSLKPMTLHRLLKVVPGSPQFKHNAANPLPEDVIVVDEASMVDAALLAKLLDGVAANSRLILLGDKNQLASVEAGSILGDLCQDGRRLNVTDAETAAALKPIMAFQQAAIAHPLCGHIIELKKSYRFGEDSSIGRLSRHILAGKADAIVSEPGVRVDTTYDPGVVNAFLEGFENFIREPDIARAYLQFNALRILCAVREGGRGVSHMNGLVEVFLKRRGLIQPQRGVFYENRPVMIGRNYYEAGLFNGDTGIIRTDPQGNVKAWFPDPEKPGIMRGVPVSYIAEAQTVYAMTIHKSQGSEFDQVLVVLPEQDRETFLTRELLYTAVTRAKKEVILQGTQEILAQIIARTVRRVSGINERFEEGFTAKKTH